ncbi:hypothetical protein [Salibacterium aidingense]|uniref:hypothetical protein n=1 Tax=Salibacterium aidingense TaxID=384933 RepID=UPI0004195CD8|nr:hypothetical protein [Salibacterium aidingense]
MIYMFVLTGVLLLISACFYFHSVGEFAGIFLSIFFPSVTPFVFEQVKNTEGVGEEIVYAILFFIGVSWLIAAPGLIPQRQQKEERTAKKETASSDEA